MTKEEIKLFVREAFNSWRETVCDQHQKEIREVKRHVDSLWWKLTVVLIGGLIANGVIGYLVAGV